MKKIENFSQHRWLSNFYPAPVTFEAYTYASVEHAYQAAKTLDDGERELFRDAQTTASIAKKLGKKVTVRADWDMVRLGTMEDLVWQKFSTHPDLAEKLLSTGDAEIEEGNWWNDRFWGVCKGVGENNLGKILMRVRLILAQSQ